MLFLASLVTTSFKLKFVVLLWSNVFASGLVFTGIPQSVNKQVVRACVLLSLVFYIAALSLAYSVKF